MKVLDITEKEFEKEVMNSNDIVILDMYANWCGPCKLQSEILNSLELSDNYKIVKIDVDNNRKITKQFGILSIPVIIIFKEGKEIVKLQGLHSKEDILNELKSI